MAEEAEKQPAPPKYRPGWVCEYYSPHAPGHPRPEYYKISHAERCVLTDAAGEKTLEMTYFLYDPVKDATLMVRDKAHIKRYNKMKEEDWPDFH